MSGIARAFERCREEERAAFIPFLMAGDPDLARTAELVEAMAAGGADLIELGVPFSDPIADGPVNQAAAARALASGTRLAGILEMVARRRASLDVPIVLFTYFNPLFRRGLGRFAEQAAASGIDGVLCVDLPPEEAENELVPELVERDIDPIFLLSPTSTKDRVRRLARSATGFVYYVSRTGVTGERSEVPPELAKRVRWLRRKLSQPVAVGFGVSTPDQVARIGRIADGVVVGSALVRIVAEHGDDPRLPRLVEERVRELSRALGREEARRSA